jgi:hypothetical protein
MRFLPERIFRLLNVRAARLHQVARHQPTREKGTAEHGRTQPVVATGSFWAGRRTSSRASAGVRQPSVFRGRALRAWATAARIVDAMRCEIRALREVLAQQPVGVLVRSALPWAVRIAEVDAEPGVDAQLVVLCHLRSLAPGQRTSQLLGQGRDRARDRVANRLGTMPCERRAVLRPRPAAMARHRRQMEQHREARGTLDQRADRRAAEPEDQVALPVARHRPVRRLCRALADHHLGRDEGLAAAPDARSRHA